MFFQDKQVSANADWWGAVDADPMHSEYRVVEMLCQFHLSFPDSYNPATN